MSEKNILKKGEIINDTYEIICFIGKGAYGEAYRVKHKFIGLQVLKVFKEDYIKNTDIATITKEANILSILTHPNIVRVFESNTFIKDNKKYFFITMEFVSGETLTQLIKRKIRLPLEKALSFQIDYLNGLKYIHQQNPPIIHRDINPDNILLSYKNEKPKAMLSDFGLAQSVDNNSLIGEAQGRYIYFAPECFWGVYLPSSDVFSAGIVFYQMITGIHPWQYDFSNISDNSSDIKTMVLSARKIKPKNPSFYNPTCNKFIDEIILKSLSKELNERYKNGDEFLKALTDYKKGIVKKQNTELKTDEIKISKNLSKVNKNRKGFDEIAGMQKLKEILTNDIILPLSDKELYEEYKVTIPNGMLLFGPPGCGKTFVSKKFAEEVDYNFIEIKPSDIASTYHHGTQEKISKLFKTAREKAPTIIFVDEIDAIMPNRESNIHQSTASEVNEFLAQMTDCSNDNIFIIAATNRPDMIDPALLRTGRIDKVIYIEPPDFECRKEMFKLYLKDRPITNDIDLNVLAELTNNYVTSDIKFIINEASRNALKNREKICQNYILDIIRNTPPSISKSQIYKYEQFKNKRNFI